MGLQWCAIMLLLLSSQTLEIRALARLDFAWLGLGLHLDLHSNIFSNSNFGVKSTQLLNRLMRYAITPDVRDVVNHEDSLRQSVINLKTDVLFSLYTRERPDDPFTLSPDDPGLLAQSPLRTSRSTKVLIHGWNSNQKQGSGGSLLKKALLRVGDFNVIQVDWSRANSANYMKMVLQVQLIAEHVCRLLRQLSDAGAKMDDLHLIGHSLGAHIAGATGACLGLGKAGMGKITGLDAANPGFATWELGRTLGKDDAAFVESVHTDGGLLAIMEPIGHVDFYPNGGTRPQPLCGLDSLGVCSHCYSFEVYRKSIENSEFVATKCESWKEFSLGHCDGNEKTMLGLNTDTSARGSFFLDTSRTPGTRLDLLDLVFNSKARKSLREGKTSMHC